MDTPTRTEGFDNMSLDGPGELRAPFEEFVERSSRLFWETLTRNGKDETGNADVLGPAEYGVTVEPDQDMKPRTVVRLSLPVGQTSFDLAFLINEGEEPTLREFLHDRMNFRHDGNEKWTSELLINLLSDIGVVTNTGISGKVARPDKTQP